MLNYQTEAMIFTQCYNYKAFLYFIIFFSLSFTTASYCQQKINKEEQTMFTLLPSHSTNIDFNNKLVENEKINILTYEYFHNGGGVAIGDVNNDGLSDVYFTGNLVPNKLYLNQGNLTFKDITEQAKVAGSQGWNTGVTMVDINQDGWLDIYVCQSGDVPAPYRANQLFVNNGRVGSGKEITFTEMAKEFGIADTGYATQASFFDYDLDGDLDLFILNHNIKPITDFSPIQVRSTHAPNIGDKLYRNDDGKFTDVTQAVGIKTNPIGYGLGVSVGDVNNDQWPDIYVANDFIEHDYLYINNGKDPDGVVSFTESVKTSFPQISQFSMGTDIADFNNDGWLDIISVDMVAEDNYRQKTTMRPMSRANFNYAVADGFHYQYMHNALQLNRGTPFVTSLEGEKKKVLFSNISKLADVSNTDWSWAPLFADLDLDGHKDLLVTNGYKRDISNKDYGLLEKKKLQEYKEGKITNQQLFSELLEAAPVTKISNYVFKNNGAIPGRNYTFSKKTDEWNFNHKAFSNGMAYGDLDNDGDLDIVINNIDDEAFIYQNNAREKGENHFIKVKLKGPASNVNGLGARMSIRTKDKEQVYEHYVTRGFQSSVDYGVVAGLGKQTKIDEIEIQWPDGKKQIQKNVKADQVITIEYDKAKTPSPKTDAPPPLFSDVTQQLNLQHRHLENDFDDFEFEVLLPHKMSEFGPYLSVGDVNGDELDDFFIGGPTGLPGSLYIQQNDGTFENKPAQPWLMHSMSEDMGSALFDADNDGDLDFYVVSGGNEFIRGEPQLLDRLYINDGTGSFSFSEGSIPAIGSSGSVVKPADFDNDGDLDLFIGGRMMPRGYPLPANSYLLRNNHGTFEDITGEHAIELQQIGMVTDAIWTDINQDDYPDLILAGEWMPITIMINDEGRLTRSENSGLEDTQGWWFSLAQGDFDRDGDVDFIGGNLGLNYKYKTSKDAPFQVYLNDFDQNNTLDIVLGYFNEGELFPLRGRECSAEQMPFIKKKFPSYDLFGQASLKEIYGNESLSTSYHLKANTFASSYIENLGNGKFRVTPLPIEAQFSAINGIVVNDFDDDGHLDLLTAGNLYASEVETPRNDAGVGLYLKGNGKGEFTTINATESGLYLPYNVRSLAPFNSVSAGKTILVGNNNDYMKIIKPTATLLK